jgi:uncharacterized membrane protein
MSGLATTVGAAVFAIAWLIGTVMILALAGLSKQSGRVGMKTSLRAILFLAVMAMAVGMVTAFVDAVDADDAQKATAAAGGVGGIALLVTVLAALCICGGVHRRQPVTELFPAYVAFGLFLIITVMACAALVCYQVEWDVDEHTAMKVGLCVTGASSFSLMVLVSSLVLLWSRSAETEEERTTRVCSIGAIVGLCLFSSLVLAGSCLVWLTDAVRGEENVKKATALAGGVLGIAGLFLIAAMLSFAASWTKSPQHRAGNRRNELASVLVAGISFSIVSVCILLMVSWQLDWPGGQGPAVLGGFLGICAIFLLILMLYICASLPKWIADFRTVEKTQEKQKEQVREWEPLTEPQSVEEPQPEAVALSPAPPTQPAEEALPAPVQPWSLDEGPPNLK